MAYPRGHPSAAGRAQDRESSPARDRRSTTEPRQVKKGKGGSYSITERRVPELIPVLGSRPAGDVSHKPGGRLP